MEMQTKEGLPKRQLFERGRRDRRRGDINFLCKHNCDVSWSVCGVGIAQQND